VLTHIYDRDFDKMLGLLKQAEFNWIWVTWSSGWSLNMPLSVQLTETSS
jgi:hypothetical protein